MNHTEFLNYAFHQHDVVCNQKYDKELPYSTHLRMVVKQAGRFLSLLPDNVRREEVLMICVGHDLIEDARVTYNDLLQMGVSKYVAEGIFLCTEFRGRNRKERKPDMFYLDLKEHSGAVFAKLCDITANSLYSLATNSSMFEKQKQEWVRIATLLYEYDTPDRFGPMFDFLRSIYNLTATQMSWDQEI